MSTATTAEKKKTVTVTDARIDGIVREKLITARIALLLKAPFFGNLATRLKLVNADEWLPTAATDGRNLYYNSEFVNKLPQKQIEFLVGHEVLHLVYDHMGRAGDRDKRLYNCAADYCVNADLKSQRIGDFIPIGLYNKKYDGWSSEEVYDDLYKNADEIDIDELVKGLLDEHLDPDEGDPAGEGNNDGTSSRPGKMTAEEKKALRDEIREAVLHAAEAAGSGNLPSGVKRMINQLTNPQLNWRELIRQQVQSLVKSDFTWARPNRKGQHMDAILPGNSFAETIDVSVSIDASGSMSSEMLHDILSEVKGIMEAFDDFKLNIWTFDTKVYGYEKYTPDNIDDIDDYALQGGGGTDFECNWEFMRDNEIAPKLFIMFTDGYPNGGWGDEDYADTLFVIHGSTSIESPFGTTAYYDLSKGSN